MFTTAKIAMTGLLISLSLTGTSHAGISVTLAEPDWQFVLRNDVDGGRRDRDRLNRDESNFIRDIQPLLSNKDYDQVYAQFQQRDIQQDGASLRELRGQVLLSLKRYPEAEKALLAALELEPRLPIATRSLSLVYMVTQQFDKARRYLVKSVELGQADAQLYGQLAYVNLQLHQAVTAVAGYQNALLLEPENKQWYQGLLFALINSADYVRAQALLEDMLNKDPDEANLWLQRGQIALRQGRHLQALSSLETALQLGDNNLDNVALTAQLHIQYGSPERAVALLNGNMQRFITEGDKPRTEALEQVAQWLAVKQDWTSLGSLLASADKYSSKLPGDSRAQLWVYQAEMLINQNKLKSAEDYLAKAIKQTPANGEALLTMARLQRDQKNTERAKMYYLRAEALPEYQEQALQGRAQLAINQKSYPEALVLLRQIYKQNPNRTDLLGNIQSLENIVKNQS